MLEGRHEQEARPGEEVAKGGHSVKGDAGARCNLFASYRRTADIFIRAGMADQIGPRNPPIRHPLGDFMSKWKDAMRSGMKPHVVRQGETLASIVGRNGGRADDAAAAWKDSTNDDLRQLRGDSSVLFPGDVIYVPELKQPWLPASVGAKNSYTATIPVETVKIAIGGEKPLAGEPYVIHGLGADIPGTTDGSGMVTVDVPINRRFFILELTNQGYSYRVLVGHLDPVTEPSGVRQRLSNLGYTSVLAQAAFGSSGNGIGLLAFQIANGTGSGGANGDEQTTAALKKAHGT